MNIPEWLKPGIYGAVIGAVGLAVVGFSWGGWMTAGEANKLAMTQAHDSAIAALVPVCLDNSRTDIDRIAKLSSIREMSNYKRRDAVIEAGWATIPGTDTPNRDLAQACMDALKIDG